MKISLAAFALIPAICALAVKNGCVFDETSGEAVVKKRVCVLFNESQETGTFTSSVVCDLFKKRLLEVLDEYDLELSDIERIGVIGGRYKVVKLLGHDWTMTASVAVSRQDDASGPVTDGPAVLLNMTTQSLRSLKGKPTVADLNSDGVDLLNRALNDLLTGADPRIVLTLGDTDVDPVPTAEDPLDFKWLACVDFQVMMSTP